MLYDFYVLKRLLVYVANYSRGSIF